MRNLLASDLFTDSELRMFCGTGAQPERQLVDGCRPECSEAEMPTVPTPFPDLCDECEHPIKSHGKYGCEIERGDNLAGTAALPPCGCKAHPDYHSRHRDDYGNYMSAAEEESDGPDPHDMEVETEMEREVRDGRSDERD